MIVEKETTSVRAKDYGEGEWLSEVELAEDDFGLQSGERKVGSRSFASEATPTDFGAYARAAAELVCGGGFSRRRHIQPPQTTAMTRPASAIPPAPLSGL